MNRSLAAVCCFLALSVTACTAPDFFSQEKKSDVPSSWQGIQFAEIRLTDPGAPAVEALSQLLERGRATPGIQEVAVTDALPVIPDARELSDLSLDGNPRPVVGYVQTISADFFRLMAIPLIRGRAFTASDRQGSVHIALVSKAFAQQAWPGEDPLGRRIRTAAPSDWLTVVGVVEDAPRAFGVPEIYLPYTQAPGAGTWYLFVRTEADPASLAASLRQTLSASPGARLGDLKSLKEI